MNLTNILIFLILFLNVKEARTPLSTNLWVVWNIGQGQWVTHIQSDECWHFDMGGETSQFTQVRAPLLRNCASKYNRLFLSHWDYDHYAFIPMMARQLRQLCWQQKPSYDAEKTSVEKIEALKIPFCRQALPFGSHLNIWTPLFANSTNESSNVFIDGTVLAPGDSPQVKEKLWVRETDLKNVKVLILGHHGSRTSTGVDLLQALPSLVLTISSARYAKYHHPHAETLKRLADFKRPILKTEDWGNIWFE
ncbi:MAG: ComEC/Rec2 family competence protein [Pseudobdellovibrio sp.]